MSQPRFNISPQKPYQPKRGDYAVRNKVGTVTVETAEMQGTRPEQEDGHGTFACNEFKKLTKEKKENIIKKTFENIHKACQSKNFQGGATACITFAWIEENPESKQKELVYCCANAGDTSSFLCIADEKNNIVSSTRLNTYLHTPDEKNPENKLIENVHWIRDFAGVPRLGGKKNTQGKYVPYGDGIMMTKSLGDFA